MKETASRVVSLVRPAALSGQLLLVGIVFLGLEGRQLCGGRP